MPRLQKLKINSYSLFSVSYYPMRGLPLSHGTLIPMESFNNRLIKSLWVSKYINQLIHGHTYKILQRTSADLQNKTCFGGASIQSHTDSSAIHAYLFISSVYTIQRSGFVPVPPSKILKYWHVSISLLSYMMGYAHELRLQPFQIQISFKSQVYFIKSWHLTLFMLLISSKANSFGILLRRVL